MSGLPKQVAIVGGGIAGLAAAFSLQEQATALGLSVACTLIEGESSWGGKIATHRVGDLLIEAGPDSFLSQKPWALELCAKLGLSDQVMNTNESSKKAFVFSRGRLRELPEGLVVVVPSQLGSFLRSGILSLPGLARMATDFVLPAKRLVGEDESLASFFTRRLGREAYERLMEPLMAGIYAGDGDHMSLRATFPRFLEMEQKYGGFIRGMLAGRKAGRPGGTMGAASRTLFVTMRDGLGGLVEALVARIKAQGAALRIGERVSEVRVQLDPHGRRTYAVDLESGHLLTADAVILATPAYVTAGFLRPMSQKVAELLESIPYASTATVALSYEKKDVGSAVEGFGFVVPRIEGRKLLAATWSSLKWSHRAPPSQVLIRCYLGGVGREDILKKDDQEVVGLVRRELQSMAGVIAEPLYVEVNRWIQGMPQYTIGHLDRLQDIEQDLSQHSGLFVTGSAYRGIGIPDCIKGGGETAKRVVEYLSDNRR